MSDLDGNLNLQEEAPPGLAGNPLARAKMSTAAMDAKAL
jgi:hypothetical protein